MYNNNNNNDNRDHDDAIVPNTALYLSTCL